MPRTPTGLHYGDLVDLFLFLFLLFLHFFRLNFTARCPHLSKRVGRQLGARPAACANRQRAIQEVSQTPMTNVGETADKTYRSFQQHTSNMGSLKLRHALYVADDDRGQHCELEIERG